MVLVMPAAYCLPWSAAIIWLKPTGVAIVIIFGLTYATLMTLYVVPLMYDILFKKPPLNVDIGDENLDDIPDDAAEYIAQNTAQPE